MTTPNPVVRGHAVDRPTSADSFHVAAVVRRSLATHLARFLAARRIDAPGHFGAVRLADAAATFAARLGRGRTDLSNRPATAEKLADPHPGSDVDTSVAATLPDPAAGLADGQARSEFETPAIGAVTGTTVTAFVADLAFGTAKARRGAHIVDAVAGAACADSSTGLPDRQAATIGAAAIDAAVTAAVRVALAGVTEDDARAVRIAESPVAPPRAAVDCLGANRSVLPAHAASDADLDFAAGGAALGGGRALPSKREAQTVTDCAMPKRVTLAVATVR